VLARRDAIQNAFDVLIVEVQLKALSIARFEFARGQKNPLGFERD